MMQRSLIDTNIVSMFFRGHPQVVSRFEQYLSEYDVINLSIITYYEIVSGLKYRDAKRQLQNFLQFSAKNTIVPLTTDAVDVAAQRYADLRSRGQTVDDIDLLIAGTAIANKMVLVTHNRKHFDRIIGLKVEDWAE